MNENQPLMLNRKQAAAYIGIPLSSLDILRRDGRLREERIGRRVGISIYAIEDFLKGKHHEHPATDTSGRVIALRRDG